MLSKILKHFTVPYSLKVKPPYGVLTFDTHASVNS